MHPLGEPHDVSPVYQETDSQDDYDAYTLNYPCMAPLSEGGYLSLWHWQWKEWDSDQSCYFYHKAIRGRVLDALGQPQGDILTLHQNNLPPPGSDYTVDIVPLSQNRALGVWAHYIDGEDSLYDIAYRVFSADGTPLTDEIKVNEYLSTKQNQPRAAALTGGGVVVVWTSTGHWDDDFSTGIYARFLDADLDFACSELQVNSYTGGKTHAIFGPQESQEYCDVAALNNGNCVAVWQTFTDSWDISLQRMTEDGTKVGSENRVNTTTSDHQLRPSAAGLSEGGFIVVWQSNDGAGGMVEIRGRRYNDLGNPVAADFPLSTPTSSQTLPSVTALPDGGYAVVWVEAGLAMFRRFDSQDQPMGDSFTLHDLGGTDTMPRAAFADRTSLLSIFSHETGWVEQGGGPAVNSLSVQSRPFTLAPPYLQGVLLLLLEP